MLREDGKVRLLGCASYTGESADNEADAVEE